MPKQEVRFCLQVSFQESASLKASSFTWPDGGDGGAISCGILLTLGPAVYTLNLCDHDAPTYTVASAASRSCNVPGLRGPRAGGRAGGNLNVTGITKREKGGLPLPVLGGGQRRAHGWEGRQSSSWEWSLSYIPSESSPAAGKRGGWKTSPCVSPKEGEG